MIKIVAVDDEPAFAEMLSIYLKEFGEFEVVTYTSPEKALDHIFSDNADAIISDYTMIEMDGISFFRQIKSKIPDIPCLLLTGHDETQIILEAMNAGIDFIQFKSDDPSILFTDIAQKIKNSVNTYRARKEVQSGIKQRERFITIQRDLMNRVSIVSTQNQASDACLTSIRSLIGCTKGSIHLYNAETKKIELLIAHNISDDLLKKFSYGDLDKVLFSGESLYFPGPDTEDSSIISGGQIPIYGGEEVIGVLSFMIDGTASVSREIRNMGELLVSVLGNSLVRIRSEEQVRNRQEELNELYVAMEELVVVIDMDGAILNINPAVTRTLGYEEGELIGEPIHILYSPEIRDAIIFQFLDLTSTGAKIQNTFPFLTRNGKPVPVETRGTMGIWGGRNVLFCISREITERLEAEKNLHEYYERINAILSSSTAQIYMKDESQRYLTGNDPFLKFVHHESGSIEGLTDADLLPESTALNRNNLDKQVITEDVPVYNIEEEIITQDGKPVWLVTSKVPVHDQDGKVTGIVGTSLDITNLVQTRQELVRRDEILSAVSSLAYFLVQSKDWELLIPECLALLGKASGKDYLFFSKIHMDEDPVSCTISNDWSNQDIPSFDINQQRMSIETLVAGKIAALKNYPSVQGTRSGSSEEMGENFTDNHPFSYLLLPIHTSESLWGVLGFVNYHLDTRVGPAETDSLIMASGIIASVIERTQTEELFQKPVERSLVGIYLVQDGRFVYVNPRMSEILGYPRENLEMMPFTKFCHPDDTALVIERHHRIIETPDANDDYELRAVTAEGQVISLENLLSQFQYHGRPAVIGSIMDITARKNSESSLRQSLHEKDILLREVHHRVKNNMQIIVSLLRMQSSTIDNPEIVALLQESKNRILSMAMIHEKLYRTDNLVSVNLLEYLDSLASTIISDFSANEGDISLDMVCDPTIEMTIDAGIPLGLIINELLTNSFKHGFSTQKKGTISLHVLHLEPEWLDVTYKDSGKGLPEGFVLENCDSLGMQLIQNLVFQASGEMTMGSDHGIIVTLRIPMNEGFITGEVSDASGE